MRRISFLLILGFILLPSETPALQITSGPDTCCILAAAAQEDMAAAPDLMGENPENPIGNGFEIDGATGASQFLPGPLAADEPASNALLTSFRDFKLDPGGSPAWRELFIVDTAEANLLSRDERYAELRDGPIDARPAPLTIMVLGIGLPMLGWWWWRLGSPRGRSKVRRTRRTSSRRRKSLDPGLFGAAPSGQPRSSSAKRQFGSI